MYICQSRLLFLC